MIVTLGVLIASCGYTRGAMELLHRELFSNSGELTSSSPGSNFTQVIGTLHQRPGGPRLTNTLPTSADLREANSPAVGRFHFASSSHTKIFVAGWFLIKEVQGGQVDLLSICDIYGNLSPTISISNGELGGGIRFNNFTPANLEWQNRWIFLGIAAHLKSGTTADVRFYYKLPNEPMQSWAPINNGQIGIATLGQTFAGSMAYGPLVKGRLGAPAAYTFSEDDFSDIAYPSDLIEPTSRLTWYCDPQNGNDLADGTSLTTAWKTVSKINEESLYTGLLPARSHEEGATLVIHTGDQDLDLNGVALKISTPGLNVRAAQGQEWIRVKSYRSLPPGVWQPTATPNVYATTDTQSHIVLWEDDKFMNHALGSSYANVESQLTSTPGSFWTDGTTLYAHPFGSTDPRSDGKRYERSYNFIDGGAVVLNAPNLNINDIHSGKTCLANWVNNDPIGGYCLGVAAAPGRAVIKHCYLYYGSKHNIGIVQGEAGDDVLIEDVQAEQGSPYAAPGGQTIFVSFNHQPLDLQIIHRFRRCRSIANSGVIGSSAGVMTQAYPVFFVHNLGNPGEPNQFKKFEFIDCDFGIGNIQGNGVQSVELVRTQCGSVFMDAAVSATQSLFHGMNTVAAGWSLTERNCIHLLTGQLRRNPIAGTVDIQACTFDARSLTGAQGGVPQASLFTREGSLQLAFKNNLILMPGAVPQTNVFANLNHTDNLQMNHNAYALGSSTLVYEFDNGTSVQNLTLSQWQNLGYDSQSFSPVDPALQGLRPISSSPLINAGQDIGPLEDYSGRSFQHRNDIGAYELPPTTFSDWQAENFTPAEIADPAKSAATSSYANDGQPNLIKYALGIDATESLATPLQISVQNPPSQPPAVIQIAYQRSRWPTDLVIVLKASGDLLNWNQAQVLTSTLVDQTEHTETILATVLCPQADRTFVKLEVTRTDFP